MVFRLVEPKWVYVKMMVTPSGHEKNRSTMIPLVGFQALRPDETAPYIPGGHHL